MIAIPGASSVSQLEANAAAADVDLADDEVAALTEQARSFRPPSRSAAIKATVARRFGR